MKALNLRSSLLHFRLSYFRNFSFDSSLFFHFPFYFFLFLSFPFTLPYFSVFFFTFPYFSVFFFTFPYFSVFFFTFPYFFNFFIIYTSLLLAKFTIFPSTSCFVGLFTLLCMPSISHLSKIFYQERCQR